MTNHTSRVWTIPLGRMLVIAGLTWNAAALADQEPIPVSENQVPVNLSLAQALDRVMAHNSQFHASQQDLLMARAEQRQAGLLPNPELSVEVEGFGGSGPWRGFDGAETTVALSQTLETAGKRKKRQQVAGARLQQAAYGHADYDRRLRAQTGRAFYEVLAAQEGLDLASRNQDLAKRLARAVAQRVGAGKDSPIKEIQAAVTVSEQRMVVRQAESTLSAARQNLAALWGASEPGFAEVTGDIERIAPLPDVDRLLAQLPDHPTTRQWQAAIAEARASLAQAKAEPVPDVTVMGGYKRLGEAGQDTAVFGLALPLPLFNRNQGAKERATLALGRARHLQQEAEVTLMTALKIRYERLVTSATLARELREEILPRVEQAYAASVTAYEQGKFDYLEILEAQRALFETKQRSLEALVTYHRAQADLDEIVTCPMNPKTSEEENTHD